MNISRIALLSVLITAPMFSMQQTAEALIAKVQTNANEQQVAIDKTADVSKDAVQENADQKEVVITKIADDAQATIDTTTANATIAMEQTAGTTITPEQKITAMAAIYTAITVFATDRKENVFSFLDFFANPTCNWAFTKLAKFGCLKGGKFENNIKPAGRIIVSAAFAAIAYKAYQAYNAQDVDADEDDALFYDENGYNN